MEARRKWPWTACAALAVGATLVGCGGDDDEVTDPASLTPAEAPVYADAVVRPEGDQKEAIEGVVSTLTGRDDVGALIVEQVDALLAEEDVGVTYDADIEPWLGERVGFFLANLEEDADGAVLLESTDDGAAQEAIDKSAEAGPASIEDATYEGVDYKVEPEEGGAAGIVDGFVVFGTEEGLKAAVDASKGASLADDEAFQDDVEALADEPVTRGYADAGPIFEEAEAQGEVESEERAAVDALLPGLVDAPFALAASVEADSLALDSSLGASDGGAFPAPGESELLGDLPGSSWAALGFADLGESLQQTLSTLAGSGLPDAAELQRELESEAGVKLEEALGAVGDIAAFASGDSLFEAGGGVVVELLDPGATAGLIEAARESISQEPGVSVGPLALEGGGDGFSVEIPEAPSAAHVAQRDDRLVIAYGDESAEQALAPTETLADSEAFEEAKSALGDERETTAYIDFGPIAELVGEIPAAEEPDLAVAQPYLERLGYLIIGAAREDDRDLTRIVLGLE